jgi:hypothetical protein
MILLTVLALGAMSGSLAAALTSDRESDAGITVAAIPGGVASQGLDGAQSEAAASDLAVPDRQEILRRIQSGDISQEELARLRERFQNQGGEQAAPVGGPRVGSIVSIEGNTLSLLTSQGEMQATLSDETIVRRFNAGSLDDLTIGQPVSIIGQRGDTGVTARIIIAVPEGAEVDPSRLLAGLGRAGGQRGAAGGLAGGVLNGIIERIEGDRIIIETQQGPLRATVDPGQTIIQVLTHGSVDDLVADQQVTVTSTTGEDGALVATIILVTPDLRSLFGGGQGGEGFGGRARGGQMDAS